MPLLFNQLAFGDLVAFQIGTHPGYSAPNQTKWGVIKVLHLHSVTRAHHLTVALLDGLSETVPTPHQVRSWNVLVEQRFRGRPGAHHTDRPFILTSQITAALTLPSAHLIGRETLLRPAEQQALPRLQQTGHAPMIGHLDHIALVLDHEDRARHDHAAWTAEVDRANLLWQENMRATARRRTSRLKGLTLATLLSETPLAAWDTPPPAITAEIRSLLLDLAALGPKVPRPAARHLLSTFMARLNALDAAQGGLFETPEREDLMALLEEVCWAIRQKSLLHELDSLRTW